MQTLLDAIVTLFLFLTLMFVTSYLWQRGWSSCSTLRPRLLIFLALLIALGGGALMHLGEHPILAIELALGTILALAHPMAAVAMLVVLLFVRPWEILPPNATLDLIPRFFAAVALLAWLGHRLKLRDPRVVMNREVVIFVGLVIWLFISAALAVISAGAVDDFWTSFFPIVVVVFLVLNSVEDGLDLGLLRAALVLGVLTVICLALAKTWYQFGPGATEGFRLTGLGLWANPNDLAALVVMVLPLLFIPGVLRSRAWLARGFAVLATVTLVVALYQSQSRGAFLALAVGGLVYMLSCVGLSRKALIAVVMLVLSVVFAFSISRGSSDLSESSASRLNYLVTGMRMLKEHPALGVGFGNYPKLYDSYTTVFLEWGERTAHSSWVLIGSEAGIPGLLLLGALVFLALRRSWQVRQRFPELPVAFCSYGVAMSFLSHSYLLPIYLLIAFTVATSRVVASETREPALETADTEYESKKASSRCYERRGVRYV